MSCFNITTGKQNVSIINISISLKIEFEFEFPQLWTDTKLYIDK